MKRYLFLFAVVAVFAGDTLSQTTAPRPTPAPTPTAVDDDVVKISTNLIQVDVTVTDRNGKIVGDLKPEEIEIYENGEKQKITGFSFVSSVRSEKAAPVALTAGVPVPPTRLKPEQVRRAFALVIDDLSLSFESAYFTRRALKKFVNEQMQEGDLVAIVRTGAGIGALQQFTSDKRMLLAAVERVKWNPRGTGGIGAFAPIEPTPTETLSGLGDDTISDEDIAAEKDRLNANKDFRNNIFATGSLGALRFVIDGMTELPGRKSVIFFSDGFALTQRDDFGNEGTSPMVEAIRGLTDVANRASVVVYTIDARGLQSTFLTAMDQVADASGAGASEAIAGRSAALSDTQDGLKFLARQTGGFAIVNNNDLASGIKKVMNDQSYYLIGYEPDADTFDAAKRKFNKIEVKVLRKGLTARYRSGFFNRPDSETLARSAGRPVGTTPISQLQNALVSPFGVNGITLRLNALFGSDQKNIPFVRSLLHIDAMDLTFTEGTGGAKKAVFDVLAMSFGDNGQVVDQLGKTYTLEAKGETLRKMMDEGFVYHFTFPVKKPGAYQYRVAIRDAQGGKIGSASQYIEVPNLKKRGLTLSSLVLESVTEDEWNRILTAPAGTHSSDSMTDTAVRRVKIGSILRYGFEVYNARLDPAKQPRVQTQIRVFREGKPVLEGALRPLELNGQMDVQHLRASGAITIGGKLEAGDYILQVVVTDTLASSKKQVATQFIEFEVVP